VEKGCRCGERLGVYEIQWEDDETSHVLCGSEGVPKEREVNSSREVCSGRGEPGVQLKFLFLRARASRS
jgi:hypothetical protein